MFHRFTSAPMSLRHVFGPALIILLAVLTIASLLGPMFIDQKGQLDPMVADMAFGVVGVMALLTIGFTIRAMLLDTFIERDSTTDAAIRANVASEQQVAGAGHH